MRIFTLHARDHADRDVTIQVVAATPGEAQAHAERCAYAVRSIDPGASDSTSPTAHDVLWAGTPMACPSCGWALEGQPIARGLVGCPSCATPVRVVDFDEPVEEGVAPGNLRLTGFGGHDPSAQGVPASAPGRVASLGAIACGIVGFVLAPAAPLGVLLSWHALRASGGRRGIPGLAASLASGALALVRLVDA